MELDELSVALERLGAKTFCAATALQNIIDSGTSLQKLEKKVHRYIFQVSLLVTWKRGSAAFKVLGSAAKTVGTVAVLAAVHPKLRFISKAGHRLWKLGAGLKILETVACVINDMWHDGCRNTLVEFTHCAALMTRNLVTFQDILRDLQTSVEVEGASHFSALTVDIVFQSLKQFIPNNLHQYAFHVVSMVLRMESYSPLFDFLALATNIEDEPHANRLMRELESFHFTEFIEASDSKSLIAIGSFLHISREILDFLDGFQKLTDIDCHFLKDCLQKFISESDCVVKVVSFLTALDKLNVPHSQNEHVNEKALLIKSSEHIQGKVQDVDLIEELDEVQVIDVGETKDDCNTLPSTLIIQDLTDENLGTMSSEHNQVQDSHIIEEPYEVEIIDVDKTMKDCCNSPPSTLIIQDLSDENLGTVSPALLINDRATSSCTQNEYVTENVSSTMSSEHSRVQDAHLIKDSSEAQIIDVDETSKDGCIALPSTLVIQDLSIETVSPCSDKAEKSQNSHDHEPSISENPFKRAYSHVSEFVRKGKSSVVGAVTMKIPKYVYRTSVMNAETQLTTEESSMNRI